MEFQLLFIATCCLTLQTCLGKITDFSQQEIDNFMDVLTITDHSNTNELSSTCRDAMADREKRLANDEQWRIDYHRETFGRGPYHTYRYVDHDRWVNKALKCIKMSGSTPSDVGPYPSQYCFAHTDVTNNTKPIGMSAGGFDLRRETVGMCMPQACGESVTDRRWLLTKWLSVTSAPSVTATRNVTSAALVDPDESVTCVRSRYERQWYEKPLPLLDLFGCLTIIALCVISAIVKRCKCLNERRLYTKVLYAFAADANMRRMSRSGGDAVVTCLYGVRFLSMLWIVLGHSLGNSYPFIENINDVRQQMISNIFGMIVFNFSLAVDTFFVLSGTLTAYSFFRKINKMTTDQQPTWRSYGFWLRFYRHRLIRLWPLYIFFMVTVLNRFGSSHYHASWPLVDPNIQCKHTWWQNLLFINTLFDNVCMNWLWYLGNDFLYYLISPILLLTLRRSVKAGFVLLVVGALVSNCWRGWILYVNNFPPTTMQFWQHEGYNPDVVDFYFKMYIRPHTRIAPYLVGIGLGYLLTQSKQLGISQQQSAWWTQLASWALATALGLWSVFGIYPIVITSYALPLYSIIYGAVYRTTFAISCAWMIFICHIGQMRYLNAVLSWRVFVPLANLSYAVYLYHMFPSTGLYLWYGIPYIWRGFTYHFGVFFVLQFILSYALGLFVALMIEMPALNLERIFLASKTTPSCVCIQRRTEPTDGNSKGDDGNAPITGRVTLLRTDTDQTLVSVASSTELNDKRNVTQL